MHGADDYLVKPFDLEELSAQVRAALRRGTPQPTPKLRHGAVALDPAAKRVTLDDAPVTLMAREFALLLAAQQGHASIVQALAGANAGLKARREGGVAPAQPPRGARLSPCAGAARR